MRSHRKSVKDPRTVAREIPGLFDALLPALKGGLVQALNRRAYPCGRAVDISFYGLSPVATRPSMLFEVAVARAESLVAGGAISDWEMCLSIAAERQRRHFDARIPEEMAASDRKAADRVARNLVAMLEELREEKKEEEIVVRPFIPGYGWISSSEGDFSIGSALIEVKCVQDNFSLADYRQVLMYWLLSYASAIEKNGLEWTAMVLLNPRRNIVVEFHVDEVLGLVSHSASKVEVLQLFATLVEEFSLKTLNA